MGTEGDSIPKTHLHLPNDEGIYIATTQSGSTYVFDMMHRTVTRTPGPDSHPDINDGQRTLRSIIQCEVGVSGYWTMQPEDFTLDFYWQLTSPIVSIEERPR